MPAYIVVDSKISKPEIFAQYGAFAPTVVAAAGGKYLARGGALAKLEGTWSPERITILQFDSIEKAKAFYDSAAYTQARAKRAGATEYFNMIVVEGIPA